MKREIVLGTHQCCVQLLQRVVTPWHGTTCSGIMACPALPAEHIAASFTEQSLFHDVLHCHAARSRPGSCGDIGTAGCVTAAGKVAVLLQFHAVVAEAAALAADSTEAGR
jgi:hypothetical protein